MRYLKMKLYLLLAIMVLCLTGCDTEEIKNQVTTEIENAIDENKDIIKDKVNGAIDNIFLIDGAKECQEIAKKLFKAAGAEDNCTLVMGHGGHRFFADLGWDAMRKLLNK